MTDDTPDVGASAFLFTAGQGHYATPMERYRDFRALFTSDQGQKVLAEIMRMAKVGHASATVGNFDTNRTFHADGMKLLAHQIFIVAHREPKPMPTKAESKLPLERDKHG